ncbi:MAG TPA: Rieske 2Fe-2S domain-containing protein [Actinomycetota bacterium]
MSEPTIVVVTPNDVVRSRIEGRVRTDGGEIVSAARVEDVPAGIEPAAVVIDLDLERSLEAPELLRRRWPRALIAGFVSTPDRARWEAAAVRGYDLVSTRGAISAQVMERLRTWEGPQRRRRLRLMEAADTAGRLGLVHRAPETPVGPVAVYHVGKQLYAVGDVCPHAGAALSEGELHDGVVTCPLHGSQFDVRTGERRRGPSDEEIASYQVVVEGGIVYLEYG